MQQRLTAAEFVTRFADDLFNAELKRCPIPPLTETFPGLSVPDAYRIQQINVERRVAAGQWIIGHKIGLTAEAMQKLFNVNEPDYGHLLSTMLHDAAKPVWLEELIDPQIEIEPVFTLGRSLAGPGVTADDVLAATEHISVCFEVIDSRIIDWRIKLQDTVADNGSSARVILGSERFSPAGLNLEDMQTVLSVDGEVVETGNTGAILGHPAFAVAWLANTLARYDIALAAGDIILPGTCTRSYRIGGHERVEGRIEGLGELCIRLEGTPAVMHAAQ